MFSMPTPTATMREDFERVERLKEKGATTIYSRANNPDGTGRHHGLLTYMGFYDLLPTPVVMEDRRKIYGEKAEDEHRTEKMLSNLNPYSIAAAGLLPTPVASDFMEGTAAIRKDTGEQRLDSLKHMMAVLTIPLDDNGKPDKSAAPDGGTSRLSPLFTEEMMGFPLMWTALPFLSESGAPKPSKPTATPSSPK